MDNATTAKAETMKITNKIMIGGQALRAHGHDRHTDDVDFATCGDGDNFIAHRDDSGETVDLAALGEFGRRVWAAAAPVTIDGQLIADPQTLAELKGYALVEHCRQGNWSKVASDEYDLQFLGREFNIASLPILAATVGENIANEAAAELTAHQR